MYKIHWEQILDRGIVLGKKLKSTLCIILYNPMFTFVTVMKSGPKKTLFIPSILNNCLWRNKKEEIIKYFIMGKVKKYTRERKVKEQYPSSASTIINLGPILFHPLTLWSSSPSPRYLPKRNENICSTKTCPGIFIAALFIIIKKNLDISVNW